MLAFCDSMRPGGQGVVGMHVNARTRRWVGAVALVAAAFGTLYGMTGGATQTDQTARVFSGDIGMVLSYVKAGQATAFESTMKRVAEALSTSESADRRQQAVGWKVYRATAPLDGGVLLYVSMLDPVVPGADYWVPQILNEAFPTEVQELYETYAGTFADGQMLLNLIPVVGP